MWMSTVIDSSVALLLDYVASMNRVDIIRRVRAAAKVHDRAFEIFREGRNHEIWICGQTKVAIPRHREVSQFTAEGIFRDLEVELGEGWWRR